MKISFKQAFSNNEIEPDTLVFLGMSVLDKVCLKSLLNVFRDKSNVSEIDTLYFFAICTYSSIHFFSSFIQASTTSFWLFSIWTYQRPMKEQVFSAPNWLVCVWTTCHSPNPTRRYRSSAPAMASKSQQTQPPVNTR